MSNDTVASYVQVFVCESGCPVVALFDKNDEIFAEAHLHPDSIEPFIASLREAAADGAAARRPLV